MMKRFGIVIGFILLSIPFETLGQVKLFEQKDQPNGFYFQSRSPKKAPTAALQTGLQGAWWRESSWVKTLELTPEQQKKMDEAFLQNRLRLIDLTAALEKEELILEPLVENIHPGDEAKILAQIDRVADARAGLEKANSRMLLAIRESLTQEQWNKLPAISGGFSGDFLRKWIESEVEPGSKKK